MKLRYILGIILLVLVLTFLVFWIRGNMLINEENLDTSNEMTKEEIVELLRMGNDGNFHYVVRDGENPNTEYYIKDNIVVCYVDGKLLTWTDYNTGKAIQITDEKAHIGNNQKINDNSQYIISYDEITNDEKYGYTFKYLGETTLKGRDTILVQESDNTTLIRYKIDKTTGIILEREVFNKFLFIIISEQTSNTTVDVQIDVVTNEDVQKPNLDQYQIIDVDE